MPAPGTRSAIWPPRVLCVSEAGWLAVEHGWPRLAARAALTYEWLVMPGVVDPTAAELVRAVLDMGADDDWRPALVAIAAGLELEDGDRFDHERGIAAVEAAAADVEQMRSARSNAGGRQSLVGALRRR